MNEEDKKLIFEWLGRNDGGLYWQFENGGDWILGDAVVLDLNFYFKYAVPKVIENGEVFVLSTNHHTNVTLFIGDKEGTANSKDPTEAFGQALLKLIKEDK